MTIPYSRKEILYQMMHLFFAYYNIDINYIATNKKEITLFSKQRIPTDIREKFFDKFELNKDMKISVTHSHDGRYIYKWEAPKSDIEKRIELWCEMCLSVIEPSAIMYIPDKGD